MRICFVALNAYSALAGLNDRHIGGIERQQCIMSTWLAKRGHTVTLIAWDEGQPDETIIKGVRVYKIARRNDGVKGLRFLYPRWSSLVSAMKKARADIYYYNCGDLGLGQVVLWAHHHNKKVLYSVASDPDCDPAFPALKPIRERLLYRYGLLRADTVIVQTRRQLQMLKEGFGIQSTIIPMPCVGFQSEHRLQAPSRKKDGRVLWIGRMSHEKRLEWLLDLAERCKRIAFDVVGAANMDTQYSATLVQRAKSLANVTLHGRVPHNQMERFYRRASALCCTSLYEGFPNTFLEAWSLGVPVISTVDPDGLITERGMGATAGTVDQLSDALHDLFDSQDKWQRMSTAALTYYQQNHRLESTMPLFEDEFHKLVS